MIQVYSYQIGMQLDRRKQVMFAGYIRKSDPILTDFTSFESPSGIIHSEEVLWYCLHCLGLKMYIVILKVIGKHRLLFVLTPRKVGSSQNIFKYAWRNSSDVEQHFPVCHQIRKAAMILPLQGPISRPMAKRHLSLCTCIIYLHTFLSIQVAVKVSLFTRKGDLFLCTLHPP